MLSGINHIMLSVAEVERSFVFYRDILGFRPLCRHARGAYFLCGNDWICISLKENYSVNPNPDYSHLAFSVSSRDFPILAQRIITSGAKIFQDNESEGASLYFCDPDGHQLEIHVGDYHSRINSKKINPGSWQDVEFFI